MINAPENDDLVSEYRALQAKGEPRQARESLYALLERDGESPWLAREIGTLSYWLDDEDEAISWLKRALEADPRLLYANYTLGHVLRRKGDLIGAEEAYRREVQSNPENGAPFFFRALSLCALSRYDEARQDLAAACRDKALDKKVFDGRLGGQQIVTAPPVSRPLPLLRIRDMVRKWMAGSGELLVHGYGAEALTLMLNRLAMPCRSSGFNRAAINQLNGEGGLRYTVSLPGKIPFADDSISGVVSLFALDNLNDEQVGHCLDDYARVGASQILFVANAGGGAKRDASWWRRKLLRHHWKPVPIARGFPFSSSSDVYQALLQRMTPAERDLVGRFGETLSDDPILGWSDDALVNIRTGMKKADVAKAVKASAKRLVVASSSYPDDLPSLAWALPLAIDYVPLGDHDDSQLADRMASASGTFGRLLSIDDDFDDQAMGLVSLKSSDDDVIFELCSTFLASASSVDESGLIIAVAVDDRVSSVEFVEQRLAWLLGMVGPSRRLRSVEFFDPYKDKSQVLKIGSAEDISRIADTVRASSAKLLLFTFTCASAVERLAGLDWAGFRAAYGSAHMRPSLSTLEKCDLAEQLTAMVGPGEDRDGFYKATMAHLGLGYGLLADPAADAALIDGRRVELTRLAELGEQIESNGEVIRWRMSIARLQAQLALHRADFSAAEAAFTAILHFETDLIAPHLLRHVLDASYYLGLLHLSRNEVELAKKKWRHGLDLFRALVPRMAEQAYTKEFEFSETGNLFVVSKMLILALEEVERKGGRPGHSLDVGLANASLPQPVDRYQDLDVALALIVDD